MESYQQINNPKTGRLIYLYGDTYNKLIDSGEYKESYLASLPRMSIGHAPKSTSIIKKAKSEKKRLADIVIPEEILMEEILMKTDNPDFISICNSNKKFNELCKNEKFWQKMYIKYYGNSGMKELIGNISYYELFKICYNMGLLLKFNLGPDIKTIYLLKAVMITTTDNMAKILKIVSYMHNLERITIKVKNFDYIPQIPEIKNLPLLKNVNYELI